MGKTAVDVVAVVFVVVGVADVVVARVDVSFQLIFPHCDNYSCFQTKYGEGKDMELGKNLKDGFLCQTFLHAFTLMHCKCWVVRIRI